MGPRAARTGVRAAVALVAVLGARDARGQAQLDGFSLERAPRPMTGLDGLAIQSPHPVGAFGLSLQLGAEWSDSPLVLGTSGGRELEVLAGRLTSFLRSTIGVTDDIQLSVLAPVVAWQDSEGGALAGLSVAELDSPVAGDLEVGALWRLWGERPGAGLAVFGSLGLPTGDQDQLGGDGSVSASGGLAIVLPVIGPLMWQSNLSIALRPERDYAAAMIGHELRAATGLRMPVEPAELFVEAVHAIPVDGAADDIYAELMLGGRVQVVGGLFAQARFGLGASDSVGTPGFRAGASLGWMRARKPAADRDPDGDGLANRVDLCPREAEDRDGHADGDGCPDSDDDGDGVRDSDDRCPREPEDLDGYADDDGCPELDDDGDRIADRSDLCPRQPETKNGYRDTDGCPDRIPDSDGDGVVDAEDSCPSRAGEPATRGCPPPRITREEVQARLPEAIGFSLGGARLGSDADQPLAAVARLMRETPELEVLSIRGHSSSDGDPASNDKLSQARANAVLNALVMLGVEPDRLRAKGLGSAEPASRNDTARGRAANRRVDFAIEEWRKSPAATPPPGP